MKRLLFTLLMIASLTLGIGQSTKSYYHNIDAKYNLKIGNTPIQVGDGVLTIDTTTGLVGFTTSSSSGIDTVELIGSNLYVVTSSDTIIVDLASLAGGDSIWTTSSGKIENVDSLPFIQSFQGVMFKNDSIDLGVVQLPVAGVQSPNIGDFVGFAGYADATAAGLGERYFLGYNDFLGDKRNGIIVLDTTQVNIDAQQNAYINAQEDIRLNASELIYLNIDSSSNEEILLCVRDTSGSMRNNISISEDNISINGSFNNGIILNGAIPFQDKSDSTWINAIPNALLVTDGTGSGVFAEEGILFIKP